MELVPIKFHDACLFVKRYHRHHKPPVGHICSLAVSKNDEIVGVAIIGRPVSRNLDNGLTAEVTRLCTDGTKNACSKLYGAAWRACRALGYKKLITYVLSSEHGISVYAAGWKCLGQCGGGKWTRKVRPRVDKHPEQKKLKFQIEV